MRSKEPTDSDRAKDYMPPLPPTDVRPPCSSWDDLDLGVVILLGLTAFVAGCVGLAVGVVTMWVVQ